MRRQVGPQSIESCCLKKINMIDQQFSAIPNPNSWSNTGKINVISLIFSGVNNTLLELLCFVILTLNRIIDHHAVMINQYIQR